MASSAANPNGDGAADEADEADEAEWLSAAPPTLPAPTTTPGDARAGASSGRDEIGASSGHDEIGASSGRDEIGIGRDEIGGRGNGAAPGDNCGGVGGENGTAHPDSSSSSSGAGGEGATALGTALETAPETALRTALAAGGEGATARALTAEEERMIDAEVKPLMRRAMLMASDARDANELGLRSSSGEASDARDAARRA